MKSAAVIAAAGLSSRMGEFKPMLCLGEQTMIEAVIENLKAAHVEEIVVVAGYKADVLRGYLQNKGVVVCENPDFAVTTMFDSLCIGLRALKRPYDKVFLTPGDVPLVKKETLRSMLESGADICRPTCGGRNGHPALFSAAYAKKLLCYDGDGGLIGAMRHFGDVMVDIPVDDEGATIDADTPEDFKVLRRLCMKNRSGGRVWADVRIQIVKDDVVLDPVNAQFLEMIEHTGSIQGACTSMHMSYTKGWHLLNRMEENLGYALVDRAPGGSNGGGSRLTFRGHRLLESYFAFRKVVRECADAAFLELFQEDLQ